ncbi:MAG: rRNA pseudouridine synthase [Ruminococcaceae bacterium]|nr:rRNA pseudouridine synthase [Oscillospiraceae bacterium]
MEEMRLQKYLALAGVASRRAAEQIITEGRVSVNGTKVTELGTKVTEADEVCVDGAPVKPESKKMYIMLNKPVGYVTTVSDEQDRPTVMDLLGDVNVRVYPVGRLDFNTEGLLLFSNDGDFTYKITHPKHKLDKTYEVLVTGKAKANAIRLLESGVVIDGRKTAPAKVTVAEAGKGSAILTITIHEGRNRQVRKMCQTVGFKVLGLRRTFEGGLSLGNLPMGKWRHLSEAEVKLILKNASADGGKK